MCVAFLFIASPRGDAPCSFALAMNRDESFARPTRPAHWWEDAPDVCAGRDLEAGGTWLGVTTSGRVALLTNVPGEDGDNAPAPDAPSRGDLVAAFLKDPDRDLAPETYASRVAARRGVYNGFNLVVGRIRRDPGGDTKFRTDFWYVGNRGAARVAPPRRLDPADNTGGDTPETPTVGPSEPNRTEPNRTGPDRLGGGVVIGVGNAPLFCAAAAEEWPKVAEGEAATRDALAECFAELARDDTERVTAPAREDPPGEVDRGVDDREGDDRDRRGFDALADRLAEALTRRALEHPGGAFASEDAFDPLSDDDDAPAAGGVGVRKTTSEDVRKRRRFLRPGDAGAGSEGYGTRSCSVVVADKRGAWAAYERSAEWRSVDGAREDGEGLEGLEGVFLSGDAVDRPLERRGAKRLAWGDVVVHRARLVADDETDN